MPDFPQLDAIAPETLCLRDQHWKIVVQPAHGGRLLSCEFDGAAVLQPAATPPGDSGSWPPSCYFPLIPFSNRIEHGEFHFDGARIRLRSDVTGTPHAMHGHGWRVAWHVRSRTTTECSLVYRHEANDEWPWRYEGTQSFAIARDAMRLTLAIRNLGSAAMPCGLGFHPFFPARAGARLQLRAARVWNGSAAEFPRETVAVPARLCFQDGARLTDRLGTDHCFEGWQRRAVVTYGDSHHPVVVEGCESTGFLVVYVPEGADYFCIEPVTHAVNAMNLRDPAAGGLWRLQPDERREIAMTISR